MIIFNCDIEGLLPLLRRANCELKASASLGQKTELNGKFDIIDSMQKLVVGHFDAIKGKGSINT